jgi:hypothetical protein
MEKGSATVATSLNSPNADPGVVAQASNTTPTTTPVIIMPTDETDSFPPLLASPFTRRSLSPSPTPPPPKKRAKKRKFPTDFFATKAYNRAALYGETLRVLQEDHEVPHFQKEGTLVEKVEELTEDALTWCCGWGGVAYWPISLRTSYMAACELDRSDKWEEELLGHASNGRFLLFRLTSAVELIADRSRTSHRLKEMLRILMETMQMVTMGLTILNMRCSILPNNVWSVRFLYDSSSSEEEDG